jgi:hypothetical protein
MAGEVVYTLDPERGDRVERSARFAPGITIRVVRELGSGDMGGVRSARSGS